MSKIRQDLLNLADAAEGVVRGYRPTRFRQMLHQDNYIAAMRKLLRSPDSYGLSILAQAGRLDLSLEKYVLNDTTGTFSREDKKIAKESLDGWGKAQHKPRKPKRNGPFGLLDTLNDHSI